MEKHLEPEMMSPSGSHPPELDYSKIEKDKSTPTVISMSPEYPKYRNKLIIGSVILLLVVFMGGVYLLTRHKEWSVRKFVENVADRKMTRLKESNEQVTKLDQQRGYSEAVINTFPKPNGLVNDFANVIPQSYEQKIVGITSELLNKTSTAVVVVTMPDIGGAEIDDYANRLYSAWGIGKAGVEKGVLIFITIKERKVRIETGAGVVNILPDDLAKKILDREMIPYLGENKFGEGLLNGTIAVSQTIANHARVNLTNVKRGTSANK